MSRKSTIDAAVLRPGAGAEWYAALSATPAAEDIERTEALLAGGELRPNLRLVARRENEPFGRMAAKAVDRLIRFWHPNFRADTPPEVKSEAMRCLVRQVIDARTRAGLTHLALETSLGDDLPDNDLWMRALAQEGLAETSAYRVYVRSFDQPAPPRARSSACAIGPVAADREADLAALYRRVKADTLDRRSLSQVYANVDDLKQIGNHDPSLWILAQVDHAAAGFALANLAEEPPFEGTSAWLVDIGCAPEHRRKGIAAALLDEACARAQAAGARRMLAAVDDLNLPSIRLHAAHGFAPLTDRFYVYGMPADG